MGPGVRRRQAAVAGSRRSSCRPRTGPLLEATTVARGPLPLAMAELPRSASCAGRHRRGPPRARAATAPAASASRASLWRRSHVHGHGWAWASSASTPAGQGARALEGSGGAAPGAGGMAAATLDGEADSAHAAVVPPAPEAETTTTAPASIGNEENREKTPQMKNWCAWMSILKKLANWIPYAERLAD